MNIQNGQVILMSNLEKIVFERTYLYEQILSNMNKLNIDKDSIVYLSFRDVTLAFLEAIKEANQMTEYKNWVNQYEEW